MKNGDIRSLAMSPITPRCCARTTRPEQSPFRLPGGEELQAHQVHERAYLLVADVEIEISQDGNSVTGASGFLSPFEPNERKRCARSATRGSCSPRGPGWATPRRSRSPVLRAEHVSPVCCPRAVCITLLDLPPDGEEHELPRLPSQRRSSRHDHSRLAGRASACPAPARAAALDDKQRRAAASRWLPLRQQCDHDRRPD
jgi:hypothetical protein